MKFENRNENKYEINKNCKSIIGVKKAIKTRFQVKLLCFVLLFCLQNYNENLINQQAN